MAQAVGQVCKSRNDTMEWNRVPRRRSRSWSGATKTLGWSATFIFSPRVLNSPEALTTSLQVTAMERNREAPGSRSRGVLLHAHIGKSSRSNSIRQADFRASLLIGQNPRFLPPVSAAHPTIRRPLSGSPRGMAGFGLCGENPSL